MFNLRFILYFFVGAPAVLAIIQLFLDMFLPFQFQVFKNISSYAEMQTMAIALAGLVLAYDTLRIKRLEMEERELDFVLYKFFGETINFAISNNSHASYVIGGIYLDPSILNKYEKLELNFKEDGRSIGYFVEDELPKGLKKWWMSVKTVMFRRKQYLQPVKLNLSCKDDFELGKSIIIKANSSEECFLEITLNGPFVTAANKTNLSKELSRCLIVCYKHGNPKLKMLKNLNFV